MAGANDRFLVNPTIRWRDKQADGERAYGDIRFQD
jgi:hypothetical protein